MVSKKGKRNESSESDESSVEEIRTTSRQTQGENSMGNTDSIQREFNRKAIVLVRLALFNQHKNIPLKKDDIVKKVLKGHSRLFPSILEIAQKKLEDLLGMELVELPAKEKTSDIFASQRGGSSGKTRSVSSGLYVLRNKIDFDLREEVVEVENETAPQNILLLIILSLIYVNLKELRSEDLFYFLKNLNLLQGKNYPELMPSYTSMLTESKGGGTLDTLIKTFITQGYLLRLKVKNHAQSENNAASFIFRWGPRAKVEFSEEDVKHFIAEVVKEKF
ncbi:Melanoma-associated antigen D2 [Clydaea vesicula]|uniref:Melanoma-associated antigen D2 n=1 Tax=Clydaea vesicula TaxID=447962 RepID=A0AAD5XTM3_9FUNG|nr:Melanoma-associated antigen D2 [Clydaea vesicula]KAJ3390080.1 Melanoma-associated antigen D2 [Lobulomyces angularis]